MNVLEKILKELEKRKQTHKDGLVLEVSQRNIDEIRVRVSEMERVEEIIRSHMDEVNDANVPSNWIPIRYRDTTDEDGIDKEKYPIFMDCPMPNDGDEILITLKNGEVLEDTCFDDDGCYLDSGFDWVDDVKAWMPKPEGYKGGKENE